MANVHTSWINGALVFWDTYRHRWVDAFGTRVNKDLDHFMRMPVDDTTGDPTEWVCTITEAGTGDSTATLKDAQGGFLRINAAANELDGISMQKKGLSFMPSAGEQIYFGAKVLLDEGTESTFFIGLCSTDTDLKGGMTSGIYFNKPDSATTLNFVTENATTATTTAVGAMVTATTYILEFLFDGTSVYAYVDGVLAATHTTNIPTAAGLSISIEYLNGAGTMQNKGADIDWLNAIQIMNS